MQVKSHPPLPVLIQVKSLSGREDGGYKVTQPWDYNLRIAYFLLSQKNAILFDIRTHKEFCTGHLCGAINIDTPIPTPTLDKKKKEILRKKFIDILTAQPLIRPIIVYCQKGKRSNIATNILMQLGFKQVVDLGGVDMPPLNTVMTRKIKLPYLKVCDCTPPKK